MNDTTTKASDVGQMDRMKGLAEINPDVWRHAFAWLTGVGRIRPEMSKDIDKAIDYVERTYPIMTDNITLPAPTFPTGTVSASVISLSGSLEMADPQSRYLIESWVHWKLRVLRMRLREGIDD